MDGGLECDNLIKEMVGGVGCGLAALHLKSTLVDKVFTLSRNWLALGGEGQSL